MRGKSQLSAVEKPTLVRRFEAGERASVLALVYRFHESARIGGIPFGLTISISPSGGLADGEMVMAAPRRVIEVSFSEKELSDLACVSRSRTEPASHVQRACILLTYREKPSLYATGRTIGVTHQTVERCSRRARKFGVMAALDDSPRPGREPTITSQARTFCRVWRGSTGSGVGSLAGARLRLRRPPPPPVAAAARPPDRRSASAHSPTGAARWPSTGGPGFFEKPCGHGTRSAARATHPSVRRHRRNDARTAARRSRYEPGAHRASRRDREAFEPATIAGWSRSSPSDTTRICAI